MTWLVYMNMHIKQLYSIFLDYVFINLGPSLAAGKYIDNEHGKASGDLQC